MSSPASLEPSASSSYPTISTALLLRAPISPAEGTDSYHDAFGTFCLPSFPISALDSGAATPIAAGFGLGMTAGGTAGSRPGSHGEGNKDKVRIGGTSTLVTTASQARPEEMLLQALQNQQMYAAHGREKGSTSPKRNYTRNLPLYADGNVATLTSKEDLPASPSTSKRKASFVLTTHHTTSLASPGSTSSVKEQREWCVTSIPVLSSQGSNQDEFDEMLTQGSWGGVVATSTRAWEIWRQAAKRCSSKAKTPTTDWPQTPFFLISPRTAASFRSSILKDVPSEWAPSPTKAFGAPANAKNSGADAEGKGAGEALGQYIVGWLQRRRPAGTPDDAPIVAKPLLLLQGDKSLQALPDVLKKNQVPYQAIRVYETCEDPSLEDNLNRLQIFYTGLGLHFQDNDQTVLLSPAEEDLNEDQPLSGITRPDWIVFFSPSGVDYSARHLQALGWLPPSPPDSESDDAVNGTLCEDYPRYVALGPTTANHLRNKYRLSTQADLSPDLALSASDSDSKQSDDGADSNGHLKRADGRGRNRVFIATSTDPKGVKEAITRAEAVLP